MELGQITEPNIVNPVVLYFHLVIKPTAHFYSGLFILCSQFSCFTWMWYGKSLKSSFTLRTVLIQLRPNSWECRQQDFFGFWTADKRSASILLSSGTSGSARSSFINIMNSSFSLKLLYNPPYCLSVSNFSNCKMYLILSLGFNNRFGLK